MASSDLPAFKRPPVIETVLGVQFDRLPAFHNFHLGLFWKHLGPPWTRANDAAPLEPQFEQFGGDAAFAWAQARIKLSEDVSSRIQIRNAAGNRMVQAQNGRLHFNWLGTSEPYPRYSVVRPELDNALMAFRSFLALESLGEMKPNQWEVTYVNHIPKGIVWKRREDWAGLFRGLVTPPAKPGGTNLEGFGGEWHYEIPEQRGRLHVNIRSGIRQKPREEEILILTLTARGPASDDATLSSGLNLGREVIVKAFCDFTSDAAQLHWERIK
ncbi:MAG: TIGR04255 family protein [Pirellulales bacterium]